MIPDQASLGIQALIEDQLRQHIVSVKGLFGLLHLSVERMIDSQVSLLEDVEARNIINQNLQTQVDEVGNNKKVLLAQVANTPVPVVVPVPIPVSHLD